MIRDKAGTELVVHNDEFLYNNLSPQFTRDAFFARRLDVNNKEKEKEIPLRFRAGL